MSLIVTGSIGIDSIEAPTGTAEEVLGGSCVYFAAAASFFGPVRLVAAVGDDFPDRFVRTFDHFHIDTAGLERRAGSRTFRWRGRYQQNMNLRDTLEVQLGVLAERLPPVPESFRSASMVFLANTHPAGQLELRRQFPGAKLVVADTMDLWIANERPRLLELLGRVDGLVLNDSEAGQLTGQSNIVRAAEDVLKLGPSLVVIKKGEHGSFVMVRQGDGQTLCGALPAFAAREVVDPTGAGDSFAGGMMGYLASLGLEGKPSARQLIAAMAVGTVVASFTLESFSLDRLMTITRDDIDARLGAYRRMVTW